MKPSYRIKVVVIVLLAAVFFTVMGLSVTRAAEILLNPTADAYVRQQTAHADTNYGSEYSLLVASQANRTGSRNKRTLLMFDLSVIPSDCTITGATLELYMELAPGESRTHELHFVSDDAWTETGVTWNNQPSGSSWLADVSTGDTGGLTLTWGSSNLTFQVSNEHLADQLISLLIMDSVENNSGNREATFASKEHPTLAIPVLRVEYSCGDKQGCSHGFWKNHENDWPEGYASEDLLTNCFTIPFVDLDGDTLADALSYVGGSDDLGGAKILLRNAVASLLNAACLGENYSLSIEEVKQKVNEALANNREAMLALEVDLDIYNNLSESCPCEQQE